MIVGPLLQSLLIGAQLPLIQRLVELVANDDGGRVGTARAAAPVVGLMVAGLIVLLIIGNAQALVRDLLTEQVRQASARRMHRAIGGLELIDYEYPQTHDRVMRASSTDFRPAQAVRSLTAIVDSAVRIIVVTVAVVVIQPLLVPALLALAIPVLIVSRLMAGDRYDFFSQMTPLERRRLYYSRMLTAREPAAETRAFGLVEEFGRRYDDLSVQRLAELRKTLGRQWRRMLGGQLAFALLVVGGVAVLGWFYLSGRANLGSAIAAAVGLAQVVHMIGALSWPVSEMTEAGLFLNDQHVFLEQVRRRRPARDDAEQRGVAALRSLTVKDVSFTYPSGTAPALDRVSFTVEEGQIIALVGPNGSGKTTLAKIIGMLYRPDAGTVLWNGESAERFAAAALRGRIASVFQDFQTYAETIRDNVAMGAIDRPVDQERVAWALRAAGFDDGELALERIIGPEYEGGTDLSGGQAQRLAVARALYRGADLLILDEPTSALDARAEHTLLSELRAHRCTTVLVSHRLANVAAADRILVFGAGRVIEEGSHEELMALGGVHRELYQLQADLYAHGRGDISISYGTTQERDRETR
ncbi:ABC transporter ATP-binding protein [Dactylosporangium sp. NPDC000555]|uniref:ABC transporter ATP-binding protein n=1 Tax=Dactylosporangium sp. NPDC000555 TaxID=3154260 RepID=UPI003329D2DF